MKRIGLSKRLRFQIFVRDKFTCRYCGKQSDEVKLVVDHITPVCQGGSNDEENLITACEPCNQGKAGKTISQSVPAESDRLRILQEHREQMAVHEAALECAKMREAMRQAICNYLGEVLKQDSIQNRTLSLFSRYADEVGIDTLFHWIDIARSNLGWLSEVKVAKYVSGIRRNALNGGEK